MAAKWKEKQRNQSGDWSLVTYTTAVPVQMFLQSYPPMNAHPVYYFDNTEVEPPLKAEEHHASAVFPHEKLEILDKSLEEGK